MAAILAPALGATTVGRAWALLTDCVLAYGQGDYEAAKRAAGESVELFGQIEDEVGGYTAVGMAGLIAISQRNYELGASLVEQGVRRSQAAGDTWNATMLRTYSAAIPLSQGDFRAAGRLAEEAVALAREMGDRIAVSVSLFSLASIAQAGGDRPRAARHFREALALSFEIGDRGNAAYCLEGLAGIAASGHDLVRAARLWGAADALLGGSEPAVYVHTPDREAHRRAVAAARARLDDAEWNAAWTAGQSLTLDESVAEADTLLSNLTTAAEEAASAQPPRYPAGLTDREVEVLGLVAQGLTNPQVAERLFLSSRTVDAHLQRIYGKLDVPNRGAAVRFAVEHGLT
jgi:non-specific serine/threonine protein kinase